MKPFSKLLAPGVVAASLLGAMVPGHAQDVTLATSMPALPPGRGGHKPASVVTAVPMRQRCAVIAPPSMASSPPSRATNTIYPSVWLTPITERLLAPIAIFTTADTAPL